MYRIRKAKDRGHFNHGWLDTYHTFSFGEYYDPHQMSFRSLRVMNEDRVSPGQGFGMHGHKNMEIVTVVLEGALQHKDSLGNGEVLRPGELQRMTAGTGIRHSEFNPSATEPVHLYQIWLLPEREGIEPSYEQRPVPAPQNGGKWVLAASSDARNGSLKIHQDASILLGKFAEGEQAEYRLASGRHAWLQVMRGKVTIAGETLSAGDGVAISEEAKLEAAAHADAELLLFDLA